jgi:hypothetical protein
VKRKELWGENAKNFVVVFSAAFFLKRYRGGNMDSTTWIAGILSILFFGVVLYYFLSK